MICVLKSNYLNQHINLIVSPTRWPHFLIQRHSSLKWAIDVLIPQAPTANRLHNDIDICNIQT